MGRGYNLVVQGGLQPTDADRGRFRFFLEVDPGKLAGVIHEKLVAERHGIVIVK
jgi:hypothetical protein